MGIKQFNIAAFLDHPNVIVPTELNPDCETSLSQQFGRSRKYIHRVTDGTLLGGLVLRPRVWIWAIAILLFLEPEVSKFGKEGDA